MAKKEDSAARNIAVNRRARRDYAIEHTAEAGVVLTGTEVKSLRAGGGTIAQAYAREDGGELYLINANIPEYHAGNRANHEPTRPRKLLLHKRELAKYLKEVHTGGMTIVPLRLYFNARGLAKVEIALARGRKHRDKREHDKAQDWKRQQARLMRRRS